MMTMAQPFFSRNATGMKFVSAKGLGKAVQHDMTTQAMQVACSQQR